ncbi:hypothetical protein [Erythrobacter sp. Alg231-14]|uniref:hypothetical protein n=1 Tax=Erythrobacter sp. Alg231-14 TaxID=1922225 RepID=UPI00307C7D76
MSTSATADVDWDRVDLAQERAAIERFQAYDQKMQDVGWTLLRGNAGFCDRVIPSVGLQLQDLASYGGPIVGRAALGMERDFAVQTAARGSPAALSERFATNREIVRLGSIDPNGWEAEERLDPERLTRAHDHIDATLVEDGTISIAFADGESVDLDPVEVCATRFVLVSNSNTARGGRDRVFFGINFPGFAYDEDVFAAAVAHELAHNLLNHSDWLDRNRRSQRNVRRTEREADRLMPWLLANAGYDPSAAQQFMETWGPRHDGGLLRNRSHEGWDERVEHIAAEIPLVRALMQSDGAADWSLHFRREVDPRQGM